MPGITDQHPPHKYDTSRWEDDGPLLPGNRFKKFLRKGIERATGRLGVVKHIHGDDTRRQRFHNEARFMHQESGNPGILPVWDVDDAQGTEPRW
ncbi:hypothetical protein ACWDA7_17160 [Streptomyces sp. NPDC001156]